MSSSSRYDGGRRQVDSHVGELPNKRKKERKKKAKRRLASFFFLELSYMDVKGLIRA